MPFIEFGLDCLRELYVQLTGQPGDGASSKGWRDGDRVE